MINKVKKAKRVAFSKFFTTLEKTTLLSPMLILGIFAPNI